jgi:hypothetical protein
VDKNVKIVISEINCSDVKEIERDRTGFNGRFSQLAVFSLLALLLVDYSVSFLYIYLADWVHYSANN